MSVVWGRNAKIFSRRRGAFATFFLLLGLVHAHSAFAIAAPTVTVSLAPKTVLTGGSATVNVTLSNSNPTSLSGVADTTTMPTGVTPVNNFGTTCGAGTVDLSPSSGGAVALSGGTLPANSSCSFSFSVKATPAGGYSIPTGTPSASGASAGFAGSPAILTVNEPLGPSSTISLSPPVIYSGGATTFTATVTNPNNVSLTGVNDTIFPAPGTSFIVALGTASCNNGSSVGVTSVSAGSYSANFTMTANSSCMFTGTLTSANPGTYSIQPGQPSATSALPGSSGPPATLTVKPLLPPTTAIVIAPSTISSGGQALATITLTNPNTVALSGVGDFITPPTGSSFVVALQNGACNGTQSVGANSFTLSGATLAANASCTIAYLITSTTAGTYPASSGTTSATGAIVAAPGPTATLTVKPLLAPIASVSLAPSNIEPGGYAQATVTLVNPNSVALTGVGDSIFPPFFTSFVVALPGGTCNGTSTVSANSFALSGATLAANASCTISYLITSSTTGSFLAPTGVTSATGAANGVQGSPAYLNVRILQTITFQTAAPVNAMAGTSYTPIATASSGLPVTITVEPASSGICSITAGVVKFKAPGPCSLDANQPGSPTFSAAPVASQIVNVQGPPVEVQIYDQAYFVAYGDSISYTVTLVNLGMTASNGVVLSTALSAGLDSTAAEWTCIAAVGGAVCPSPGTGLLSATVNLPAGGGLLFTYVVPVKQAGAAQTVTATVSATGAVSVQDINTVVILRDGFE